jgi:hypothetical protein
MNVDIMSLQLIRGGKQFKRLCSDKWSNYKKPTVDEVFIGGTSEIDCQKDFYIKVDNDNSKLFCQRLNKYTDRKSIWDMINRGLVFVKK